MLFNSIQIKIPRTPCIVYRGVDYPLIPTAAMEPPTISIKTIATKTTKPEKFYMETDILIDGDTHAQTGPMLDSTNNNLIADLVITTITALICEKQIQKLYISISEIDVHADSLTPKLKFLLRAISPPTAMYTLTKEPFKWTIELKQSIVPPKSALVDSIRSTRKRMAEQADKEQNGKMWARRHDKIIDNQLASILKPDLDECIINATKLEMHACTYALIVNGDHHDIFELKAIQTIKTLLSEISPNVSLVHHQETNYPHKTRYQFQISWNI
jgi:hypothetical protein